MKNQKGNMNVIVSLVIVIAFVGVVIYILMHKSEEVNPVENINTNQEQTAVSDTTQEQSNTSQNNMEKVAKNGDVLVMNYTGRLTSGTVFDSNVDPKFGHVEPFKFTLGAGQVIKGWDEGLVGMKVGEKKTLTITPDKGYGAQAVGPIPANSTLVFDVEVVGIE